MKYTLKNEGTLWLFCLLIGSFAGAVIWIFLKIMALGTALLWELLPSYLSLPLYPLILCTIGGLVIGLLHKYFGDYPEELPVVFGKLKKNGTYDYRNIVGLLITALFPLLIGSSVGPEAGLTGIIVALCCWAGDNLKFARNHSREYSQIGAAVTLGLLFHSPLFGIFTVEEDEDTPSLSISTSSKIVLYGLAIAGGTGIYMLLSSLFGSGLGAMPKFSMPEIQRLDYPMMLLYIIAGCLLAAFYHLTHHMAAHSAAKLPGIIRETVSGLLIGIVALLAPMMLFSGEEQMHDLMTDYAAVIPIVLILAAFFKVLLTNLCIQFGLKGGHFFPVIFAGCCLGYGIAALLLPGGNHEVFAAAVTTAATLGGIMKKPLAVTILLFLCFPLQLVLWIFLSAALGSRIIRIFSQS